LFELKNVSFNYRDKIVLHDVSLALKEEEFVLLKGPSGSGKSTFLRLLNRLLEPQEGVILYQQKDLRKYEPTALRRKIAYLQQIPVMTATSIRDNLIFPFNFKAAKEDAIPNDSILKNYLKEFYLDDLNLEDSAQNLSVGQKQRLAFIRVILLNPKVFLLDEPTSALDDFSRQAIEEKIESLFLQGKEIIMVSHQNYSPTVKPVSLFHLQSGKVSLEAKFDGSY